MKPTQDVTALVADHGLFLHMARRLARDFKKVYYWSPWERAFPSTKEVLIGDGFEDIVRVDSPWQVKDELDLAVFPDIGFAPLQKEMVSQGIPVWGALDGDSIEIDRLKFLKTLKQVGLPTPKYKAIQGITKLREHLFDQEDKWIKMSRFRGDFETMHWRSWDADEGTLDQYAVKFGPARELVTFLVFDPIDADIEDGYDGYCIDGVWPEFCVHGMEAKDKAYLGTFQKFSELPEEVRKVNEAFAPVLAEHGYRSFFSTEVRITDRKESYFIDPTCRCGSPPSQVMAELFKNYGDIIWKGAQGQVVQPEPTAKFGVQGVVSLKRDQSNWGEVEYPEDLDRWLKCSFCCRIDDKLCFVPDNGMESNDVGYLVATGNTIQGAIESLHEKIEELPDGLHCEFSALADLLKEVHKAEDAGMPFTDQKVPEPEVILEQD